jgi:hypothetical protein
MGIEYPSAVVDPDAGRRPTYDEYACLTCHIDIVPHRRGELHLRGAGRERLVQGQGSDTSETSRVDARLGPDRVLQGLETSPPVAGTEALEGALVGRGFRKRVQEVVGDLEDLEPSMRVLLDDLPMAALISGYATLYSGKVRIDLSHLDSGVLRPGICSGWRSDGTMLSTLRREGELPLPVGPSSKEFEKGDDPALWHEMDALGTGGMRRQRLVQVSGSDGGERELFAMFRDTHRDSHDEVTVLHEYSFSAVLDPRRMVLSGCRAHPRVLPWPECPAAAASVSRLEGLSLKDVDSFVSRDLQGISTCTHLNDLLRCLGPVEVLVHRL